jgi:GT2 family glycosyltransferase
VSIVIATYGREGVLCDTLRHLLAVDLGPAEIIVVDQTPRHQPETTAYLESIAERIRLVRLDRPGLPRARNVGWRAARGSIVLYLDDDVIPLPGLVDGHRHAYDDPRVGGVAGRVITTGFPLPDTPSAKSRLPGVGWLFFNFAQTTAAEVDSARGCNMSFRRAVLAEVGGFDERYRSSPCSREESDCCFRVRRLGHRIVFAPEAAVEHLMQASGGTRTIGADTALSPEHHANNVCFFLRNVPWRHRPTTLLVLLIQEFRPGRVGRDRRSWRENLRIIRLLARGMREGWRRSRERAATDGADPTP